MQTALKHKPPRYVRVGALVSLVGVLLVAFNFWFIRHAENVLEQIVYTQSNKKLKLSIQKFKFNWISNKIELNGASIYSADTTDAYIYWLTSPKITLKAKVFFPLLLNREIWIDSIRVHAPRVVFTRRWTRIKRKLVSNAANSNFSVAEEVGLIAKSISKAINVLRVDKFMLDEGLFSIIDSTKKNAVPFTVSNIYVQLDNFQFDSTQAGKKGRERISFTDNIAVRTHNQNLSFLCGRYFLAFKNFKINLVNRRVEFDSCTLRAIKGDSSKTSFHIFFEKLRLTNINFDSLYSNETIIADSVFCSRPQIILDIDSDVKVPKEVLLYSKKQTNAGRIDAVMQQLLGDMKLKYVGVKDADVTVNAIKKKKASWFSSKNNNFEMFELAIRKNEERPIFLTKFAMSLHNYQNVIKDGKYAIAFDSIGFENNEINLSKFSFREFDKGNIVSSLSMPSFKLRGISWEALFYYNIFSASHAVFSSPVIHHTIINHKKKSNHKNIFKTLNSIGGVMNLNNLTVNDGDITINFKKDTWLNFKNAKLNINANYFAGSGHVRSMQRSVNYLNLDKAVFVSPSATAYLYDVRFLENKKGIKAQKFLLLSGNTNITGHQLFLGSVVFNELHQAVIIDNMSWERARVVVLEKRKQSFERNNKIAFTVKNIKGKNTQVEASFSENKITGYVTHLQLEEYVQNKLGNPRLKGLFLNGQNMSVVGKDWNIAASEITLADKAQSIIKNLRVEKTNTTDSISADISEVQFIPHISEIFDGKRRLQSLVIKAPIIVATLRSVDAKPHVNQQNIRVDSVTVTQPNIKLEVKDGNEILRRVIWSANLNNEPICITGLTYTPGASFKADAIKMRLSDFEYLNKNGQKASTGNNKLNIELNNLWLTKNKKREADWKTNLNIVSMEHLSFSKWNNKNIQLQVDGGIIKNIVLNNKNSHSLLAILTESNKLRIEGVSGKLTTPKNYVQWNGLWAHEGEMSVDSFSISPQLTLLQYKTAATIPKDDYLKIKSGKWTADSVTIDRRDNDTIIQIRKIEGSDINLFAFKDRTRSPAFFKYKLLPTEMLLKLTTKINVDSIRFNNMNVVYEETNKKTNELGQVPVADLNVQIANVKNCIIAPTDSIYITATGNILGQLHTQLFVSQSYFDTSGYLRINITTDGVYLPAFNTVLVPFARAEILKGQLQKLNVTAIGNKHRTIGAARMYYRGLDIRLLNKNDVARRSLPNQFASRAAMWLFVRKNNAGKSSLFIYQRRTEKSSINYIIKTALEGVKSAIGLSPYIRKNKHLSPP